MKIAICDDQQIFIDRVNDLIADSGADIYQFNSGDDLLSSGFVFDIVLLDIEMSGTDGLSVAAELSRKNKKTLILFITSHGEYSTRGYEFRAFRYILKSEPDEFIKRNIQDAIAEYNNCDYYLTVNCKGEYTRILSENIIFAEACGHTIVIHTVEKDYVMHNKFKDVCKELEKHGFVQCHKSYIVNMRHAEVVKRALCVDMTNGVSVPIGRKYNARTISAYLEFIDRRV